MFTQDPSSVLVQNHILPKFQAINQKADTRAIIQNVVFPIARLFFSVQWMGEGITFEFYTYSRELGGHRRVLTTDILPYTRTT